MLKFKKCNFSVVNSMAHVFSETRPRTCEGPQTPMYKQLEDYTHGIDIQQLMQDMLTELLIDQPDDPIPFMISFLESRKKNEKQSCNKT